LLCHHKKQKEDVESIAKSKQEKGVFLLKIRGPKDFWAGIMFSAFGGAGVWMALSFPFGSAARMGPAYFPILIGGLLLIFGLFITLRGLVVKGQSSGRFYFKPLLVVLASIVLFGFALKNLGLICATFALMVFASFGGHEFRMREVFILAAIFAAGTVAVFVYALKLQIQVWP
jgi:hypothetical protein